MEFSTTRINSELEFTIPLLCVDENVDKTMGRRVIDNMKIQIKPVDVETFILERLDLVQSFLNTTNIISTPKDIVRVIIENVTYIVNKIFTTFNKDAYIDEITIINRKDLFCNIKEWMVGFVVEELKDNSKCKKRLLEEAAGFSDVLQNIQFKEQITENVGEKKINYNTLTILVDLIEFENFIWHLLYVQRDSIDGGIEILFNPEINEASKNVCGQSQNEFVKNCRKKNTLVPLLNNALGNLLKPDTSGVSICSASGGHDSCFEPNNNNNTTDELVLVDDSVNIKRRIRFIIETLVYLQVDKLVTTITEMKLLNTRFSIHNRNTTSDGSGSTAYNFGIIDFVNQIKFTKFYDKNSIIKNVANEDFSPNKRKRQDNIFINGGSTISFSNQQ